MKQSRAVGFVVIAVVYLLATAVGVLVFMAIPFRSVYSRVFWADVVATVFVYIAGVVFDNASVYDPYWSVQPLVIAFGITAFYGKISLGIFLLLAALCFWGIRLTVNWAQTFVSLSVQDWRYDMFKQRFPRLYLLISFFGIHMVPTVVVYLAMLPAIKIIEVNTVNGFTFIGFSVCLVAVFLQLLADRQMQQFRKQRAGQGELIRVGLWKYSRHPNYLGEILMWWGVYAMMLSVSPSNWVLGVGALANTMLFFFISIPLADSRNSAKAGYEQYVRETRSLFPLKR